MQQVNNGFLSCYYLTKDGKIYNSSTNEYKEASKEKCFTLKTESNETKKISLRNLYKLIYDEWYSIDNIESLQGEEWKFIADTDKMYMCSNKGRIKSFTAYNARLLKPTANKSGYDRIDIMIEGQRQTKLVHRLVAAAFLPLPLNIDYQLHHKDFDKTNNEAANLQWLSPKQHAAIHAARRDKKNVSA